MKHRLTATISIIVFLLVCFNVSISYAKDYEIMGQEAEDEGRLREALKYYMSALESTSEESSSGLREKIIKLVQKIQPPPAVPEEARRHLARGRAAVKAAKDEQGFMRAAEEFKKALRSAPWLSEGYYNLGVVLDKAAQYDEAILNLKLYLVSSPDDAQQMQDIIYEIEFRKEEALRAEREEREKLARRKREEREKLARLKEEMLSRLEGTWVQRHIYDGKLDMEDFHQLTHTGHSAFKISYSYSRYYGSADIDQPAKYYIKLSIDGNKLRGTEYSQVGSRFSRCKHNPVVERAVSGSISEDWRTITLVGAPYKFWNPFTCQWVFYDGEDKMVVFEKK